MTKQCLKCGENLQLKFFYTDRTHADGLTNICKQCWNKRAIENRNKRGRDHENEVWRKKAAKDREAMSDSWWYKISRYHHLDFRKVKSIFQKQNGSCFYCKIKLTGHNLHVEHYYPKNNERIVVACNDCNRLKWQRDGDTFIKFLKEYISRFS